MSLRLGIPGRHDTRRLVCLLVLASLLAAHVPIPLQVLPAGKDHSARFPCENRPCGCRSAEQCWRECCCHTNAEKLAWARENGVTPPDFVVAAAEKEEDASPARSCCSGRATCCSNHEGTEQTTCCDAHISPCSEDRDDDEERTKYVIGIVAQHCQGLSSHWLGLPWMIPETEPAREHRTLNVPLFVSADCRLCEMADRPPTPPPRGEAA